MPIYHATVKHASPEMPTNTTFIMPYTIGRGYNAMSRVKLTN
jgi:hypothetical protein